jgi:hypothetical protein
MNLDRAKQDLVDYNYVLCTGLLISNTISGDFLNSYKFSIFNTGFPNRQFNVFSIAALLAALGRTTRRI